MLTSLISLWRGKKEKRTTVSDDTENNKNKHPDLGQLGNLSEKQAILLQNRTEMQKKYTYVGVGLCRNSSILKETQIYTLHNCYKYCRVRMPKDKTYKTNRAKLLYLYSLRQFLAPVSR